MCWCEFDKRCSWRSLAFELPDTKLEQYPWEKRPSKVICLQCHKPDDDVFLMSFLSFNKRCSWSFWKKSRNRKVGRKLTFSPLSPWYVVVAVGRIWSLDVPFFAVASKNQAVNILEYRKSAIRTPLETHGLRLSVINGRAKLACA